MNAGQSPGALPFGIAIVGPTGSGKSALAMRIAAARAVEIISVDSAQVYRGLDVGTAKPTPEERRQVPHHLIDIREPNQVYSAGEFRTDCLELIRDIAGRGRTPLLVGGTMLYYRALFGGIADLPTADSRLRASIDARAASEGWPAIHAELAVRDPDSAARIHPNDAQRIQRALEVLVLSGRARAGHWADQPQRPDFSRWIVCMLEPRERAQLHQVIAARFAAMLANGLVDEVRQLLARGLDEHSPVLRLVGYRQLVAHCRGQESVESATDRAIAATRQLAKRQLTWMRSGKLLPSGATVLRAEPFDLITLEGVTAGLIKAIPAPC